MVSKSRRSEIIGLLNRRDRFNTEKDARGTWFAAGLPREGFRDFLERKGQTG